MPDFPYFPHAQRTHLSTWTDDARTCGGCGREGPGFEGPYYGEGDLDFVCADCLAGGRLHALGASTNSADRDALLAQLRARDPATAEALAEERARAVEERTPHLTTWQDFLWPAHCGDLCAFEAEVGQRELERLSPTGDGEAYFFEHLDPSYRDVTNDYAGLVPPHAPKEGEAWSVGVWLFRCRACTRAVIQWDCD